jgi:hypothetical protein
MAKTRIQVYADEETKRRVELAAARQDIAVTQYCLEAIRQQLAEDDMLELETIEIPAVPDGGEDLIPNLRALHQEIKAYRGSKLVDVDQELEQMREERDHELTGLR